MVADGDGAGRNHGVGLRGGDEKFAYCAELKSVISARSPRREVTVTSGMVCRSQGASSEAKAAMHNAAGTALVQTTGKYMPLKDGHERGNGRRFRRRSVPGNCEN